MTASNKSADKKQIRALDVQWGAAACQKDLGAVVEFYVNSNKPGSATPTLASS